MKCLSRMTGNLSRTVLRRESGGNTADPADYQMQLALQELIKNKTVLIIAHRLITIKNANKIEVINEGKIEAEGTHDELLQKSKTYSALRDAYTLSSDWQISKYKEVAQA